MNDPLSSLRPASRPLPPNGEERAIVAGRRSLHRRRMAYGAVGGAGALAVGGAVAYVVQPPNGRDTLRPLTPSSSTPAAGDPTPTPSALPDASPLPTPSISPLVVQLPGQTASEPPASAGPAVSRSGEPVPAGPYIGAEPTGADGAPQITRSRSTDPTFCSREAQVPGYNAHPDGWCGTLTSSGPDDIVAGDRYAYSFTLCRAPQAGATTLHFDSDQEVGFVAQQETEPSTTPRWMWGAGYSFPHREHELQVGAGDCVTWTVTWSGQDNDGYAAPEDYYEMDGLLAAKEYASDAAPPMAMHATMTLTWP